MATRATVRSFWDRVEHQPQGCWFWLGTKQARGYGRVAFQGRRYVAHRLAYILTHGPIPDDLALDHLCSNTSCVNPDHLQLVRNGLNTSRGSANKRHAGTNRYRNVQWRPRIRKWCVQVQAGDKRYGGVFEHAEVAAMQANVMSARFFPGFRAFNQVEMG